MVDLYSEEVDDVMETDAVVEIAKGAAKDKRQRDRGERERPAGEPEQDEDYEGREHGEGDEGDADAVGREVFQQREGRARVDDMREAEDAGDDGDVVAGTDAVDDPVLAEAVGDDDERAEEKEPGTAVAGLVCGGSFVIRFFAMYRSGLQPLMSLLGFVPGASPQAGIGRAVGALLEVNCWWRRRVGSRWRRGLRRSGGRRWGISCWPTSGTWRQQRSHLGRLLQRH